LVLFVNSVVSGTVKMTFCWRFCCTYKEKIFVGKWP